MDKQVKRGFTLVELLVVIAIIAVLAGVLFPVFGKAREKAYQATCISNQRQLALGMLGYAQDNGETLPLPANWVAATGLTSTTAIFHCPSSDKQATPVDPDYGMNAYLFDTDASGAPQGVTLGEISNPEKVEATADLGSPSGSTAAGNNPFPNCYTITGLLNPSADFRHNGGVIISYLDGHVQYRLPGHTPSGFGPYNLGPGLNRFYIDFSHFTDNNSAASALNACFCVNSSGTPLPVPGGLNIITHSWTIPAGTQNITPAMSSVIGSNRLEFGMTYLPFSANTDVLIHRDMAKADARQVEICPAGDSAEYMSASAEITSTYGFIRFGVIAGATQDSSNNRVYKLIAPQWQGKEYDYGNAASGGNTLANVTNFSVFCLMHGTALSENKSPLPMQRTTRCTRTAGCSIRIPIRISSMPRSRSTPRCPAPVCHHSLTMAWGSPTASTWGRAISM